jgi:hypothetical protein
MPKRRSASFTPREEISSPRQSVDDLVKCRVLMPKNSQSGAGFLPAKTGESDHYLRNYPDHRCITDCPRKAERHAAQTG